MAERYEVLIRVISQKGICDNEHKVGDEWIIGRKTPADMCLGAWHTIYPDFISLMTGGSLPWENDPDSSTVSCPDPDSPVVFELRRLLK